LLSASRKHREEEERHMVSSEQFRPHDGDEDGGQPGSPISHEEVVSLMRRMGFIPGDVPDDRVGVMVVGPEGQELMLNPEGLEPPREWHLDDIFPHTSFDDPPGRATPEKYKQLVLGVLSESADLEEFAFELSRGLGPDLVFSHGVEPDLAIQACRDFAAKIYREYRDA
jgi:hypothetical protein